MVYKMVIKNSEFVVKKYKTKTVIKSVKDKREKREYNQKVMMSWGEERVSQMKLIGGWKT